MNCFTVDVNKFEDTNNELLGKKKKNSKDSNNRIEKIGQLS